MSLSLGTPELTSPTCWLYLVRMNRAGPNATNIDGGNQEAELESAPSGAGSTDSRWHMLHGKEKCEKLLWPPH